MNNLADKFRPTLIRASAGSGKTFALSNRFIALLAHGERPDRILATTFTRKAAGEILERVYQRLADAALDSKAALDLGHFIGKKSFSSLDAQEILKRLVQNQARLNICTLDSFFISIAQSFSFELGLTSGWTLSDGPADAAHIRQAIAALCSKADPGDLAELFSLIHKGNTKTAIHAQLEREISELYSAWRGTVSSAWQWIEAPRGLSADQLTEVAKAIENLPLPVTAKGEPDRTWKSAICDTVNGITSKQWDVLITKGICSKLFNSESTYQRHPISEQCREAFAPLLTHLRSYHLGRLRAQTEATSKLLSLFAKEFDSIRVQSQTLNFEGVKHSLADAQVMGELTELYYRLDTRIAHLLLDEFQDTSRDEWIVLEPVVAEILSKAAGEQSFFCVGDTKQAIYGWRGGAAQIFETLENTFPILQGSVQRKDESRRSAPQIIETVNQVFQNLAAIKGLADFSDVVDSWSTRFTTHSTALNENEGYVELRAVEKTSEDSDISEDIFLEAAQLAADLQSENPEASVGILMRGNDGVAKMLKLLWDHKVKASGEGGNPLIDSQYVCLVLAALRLCEHPGDSISAFLVCHSELGKYLELSNFADLNAIEAFGLRVRSAIAVEGLGEILRQWVQALGPHASTHDRKRLRQLTELAYVYNFSRSTRLSEFIRWVEMTPVENPAASSVRVMTIHKAKGLEFDAVILPELDDRIPRSRAPSLLRFQPNPIAAPTRISRYADSSVRSLDPRLQEMYEQAKQREVEEALSVLYVALTRARGELYMLIDATAAKYLCFASILRQTLTNESAEGALLFSIGERNKLSSKREALEPTQVIENPPDCIKLAPSKLGRRRGLLLDVSRRMPSSEIDLAMQMQLDGEESALRNTLFRKLFRSITWLKEKSLTAAMLAEQAGIAINDRKTAKSVLDEFAAVLKKPGLQKLLTCEKDRESKVYHDLPFAFRSDNVILSGTLARLVVYYEGTKAISAEVIEFDMDERKAELKLKEKLEARRAQLETYRKAASIFSGIALNNVRATLVSSSSGETLSLEDLPEKTKKARRG